MVYGSFSGLKVYRRLKVPLNASGDVVHIFFK